MNDEHNYSLQFSHAIHITFSLGLILPSDDIRSKGDNPTFNESALSGEKFTIKLIYREEESKRLREGRRRHTNSSIWKT